MTDSRDFPALVAGEQRGPEGGVWLPITDPAEDVRQPFGGFWDSGSPFKEQGTDGLRFCSRVKTDAVRYPA